MSARPHRDPERLRDDLAAYALGALRADEAAALERHIEGCERCRERLRWLAPAVDVLPASVEQVAPPPSLRESLMATVRAEAAAEQADAAPAHGRARAPRRRRLRAFALRPAAAFAAAIALVVGIGVGYALRGSDSPETTTIAASALTAAPVSATLEREGDSGTLRVSELPPLDGDHVYEVWVKRGRELEPISTFVLSIDGAAQAAVSGLNGGKAVYVTKEPEGGSEQPTTDPLLEVPL